MNDEKRLWPPPENWVRGEDGRWWHPDHVSEDQVADDDSDTLPVWDWTVRTDDLSLTEQTVESGIELHPEPVPELLLENEGQPEQRSPRRSRWIIGTLIAVGVLGIAVLAQIVLGGSTTDAGAEPDGEPTAAAQIATFASTYCVHAAGAEDLAVFDEYRRVAVTTRRGDLTAAQLNRTRTTAVMVVCPAESDRLGLTLEPIEP